MDMVLYNILQSLSRQYWLQYSVLLQLILQKLVLCHVETRYEIKKAASGSVKNKTTFVGLENYDGGDYGGYGSWDYGVSFYEYKLDKIEPSLPVIECYTCHYTKKELYDYGMPNCDEPFKERGIPVVPCQGLCGRTKSLLGYRQYMIVRSCLPNCKNIYDAITSVECCFGDRCNGAKNNAARKTPSWIVFAFTAVTTFMVWHDIFSIRGT